MLRKTFIYLTILITFVLAGCLGGGNPTTGTEQKIISQEEVIKSLLPEREETKNTILAAITKDNTVNKAPVIGETYFALSKEQTDLFGSQGTVEISFVYIEAYGTENEQKYMGAIYYTYLLLPDGTGMQQWYEEDSFVEFFEIKTGSIHGQINLFGEPINNIYVYGRNREEYTKLAKTDENGEFLIEDVLENSYDLFIFGDGFPEVEKLGIIVFEDATCEVGSIDVLPEGDKDHSVIAGYLYFDTAETRPVVGASVWLERDGVILDHPVSNSDNNGEYVFNYIPTGTYEVIAKIENNITYTDEVNITTSDLNKVNWIENLYLLNEVPVALSYTEPLALALEVGESTSFEFVATDPDEDILEYVWYSDGGITTTLLNTCEFEANEVKDVKLQAVAKDNMGSSVMVEYDIACGTRADFELISTGDGVMSPRFNHTSVVFNDKIYVMGGADDINNQFNEVYSFDGSAWNAENLNAFDQGMQNLRSIVFDNKIIVYSGMKRINNAWTLYNDIYSSTDGTNFIKETPEVSIYSPRNSTMITEFAGKLWMIGGYDLNGAINEVWSSTDGVNWYEEATPPFNGLFLSGVAVWDNGDGNGERIWIIGGTDQSGGNTQNTWTMDASGNWTLVSSNLGIDGLTGLRQHQLFTVGNKLFMIGGMDQSNQIIDNLCYYTLDGINWIRSSESFPPRVAFSVNTFDASNSTDVFAIGGKTVQSDPYSDVYNALVNK